MKKVKTGTGVWLYLEQSGVLEHGTSEEIEAARKAYWKEVRKKWKQEKRTAITLLLSDEEYKVIGRAAKKHHRSPTAITKQAALSYITTEFIVPDTAALQEIRLLLARTYLTLQTLTENCDIAPELGVYVLQRLEQQVLQHLEHPVTVEMYIRQTIAGNPSSKERLLQIIQSIPV